MEGYPGELGVGGEEEWVMPYWGPLGLITKAPSGSLCIVIVPNM
jgi:hypothetical protein